MGKILTSTKNMSHDEWLAWRRKGVGGSDVPAILGFNKYRGIIDVWMDKLNKSEPIQENKPMLWGKRLESILAEVFMEETGKKLIQRNAIYQHKKHYFMLANIDRLVTGESAGWEGKTVNARYKDDGRCPIEFWLQCQHYMEVLNKDYWYLTILAGGQYDYTYKVERDQNYIDKVMVPAETEFWQKVINQEMPAPDGTETAKNALSEMYPEATEEEMELPEDAYELLDKYDGYKEKKGLVEGKMTEIENQLKALMEDKAKAFVFDRKVYWSNVVSSKFDKKQFKMDHPELHDRYTVPSAYRRFQIK